MLTYIEPLLVAMSFMILFGYHAWHFYQIKQSPLSTSTGFNNQARTIWVKHIKVEKLHILAVQTLRNWTMAATFLASTAIILSLGVFELE